MPNANIGNQEKFQKYLYPFIGVLIAISLLIIFFVIIKPQFINKKI